MMKSRVLYTVVLASLLGGVCQMAMARYALTPPPQEHPSPSISESQAGQIGGNALHTSYFLNSEHARQVGDVDGGHFDDDYDMGKVPPEQTYSAMSVAEGEDNGGYSNV